MEKMDLEIKGVWSEAGEVKPFDEDDNNFVVKGLVEKHRYKFRIRAQNRIGLSEPAEIQDSVLAKDPWNPPGPPRDLEVCDWDKDRVDLKWEKPLSDGGSPITHYIVECKERYSTDWIKCHMTEGPDLSGKVTDIIKEGSTYEFRVRAVNRAGPGEPCEPSKQVLCKSRFVKPFIIDDMSDQVVKVGQTLTWDVKYGGEPEPEIEWKFNHKTVVADGSRITIDKYSKNTVITIRKCQRSDTAKYKLILTNSSGSTECQADGIVLGKPSIPMGPLEVYDVRAKKAMIKWDVPEDDGGSPITGYEIEKMDLDTGRWVPCGDIGPDDREFPVDGLTPGKKYKFRVKAKNKEGDSEPLENRDPVEAKNPYREPDPPRNLDIPDFDNESVTLTYETPVFDGGRPITHYVVEQKGKYDLEFVEVLATEGPVLEALVKGLREKQVYEWRVRAVNKAGPSLPCEPTPKHTCRYKNCEYHSKVQYHQKTIEAFQLCNHDIYFIPDKTRLNVLKVHLRRNLVYFPSKHFKTLQSQKLFSCFFL